MHSTVNVASGRGPTLPELAVLLADDKPLDRTTVTSTTNVTVIMLAERIYAS